MNGLHLCLEVVSRSWQRR